MIYIETSALNTCNSRKHLQKHGSFQKREGCLRSFYFIEIWLIGGLNETPEYRQYIV